MAAGARLYADCPAAANGLPLGGLLAAAGERAMELVPADGSSAEHQSVPGGARPTKPKL